MGSRMSETTRITTLDNGLRVATETMASVKTASGRSSAITRA